MSNATRAKVVFANLVLMVLLALAWFANIRGFLVQAAGMAVFSFAFLWPQYRTERGVWMGGFLIMVLAGFMIVVGILLLITSVPDASPPFGDSPLAVCAGLMILASIFGFTAFASTVNYRLTS
ncbi:hypothetical protein OAS39_10230 [Pirellulales bacterium]|nr:hypothetical protein [Pirellulales bacterium]